MPEKKWSVEFSKAALKSLKKLKKKTYQKILNSCEELEDLDNPLLHRDVRALTGRLKGFYRLRVSDYRVIFELDNTEKRVGVHIIVP